MRSIPWVLAALLALTAGCARQAPAPAPALQFSIPEEWNAGFLAPAAADVEWWTSFDDPGLGQAILEALENSSDLRAAAARLEIARADAVIAGAPLRPSADVALSRGQQRQNFIGLPIPGGEDAVLSTTSTSYGLRAGAAWEPDLWGRIRAGRLAAVTDTQTRYSELAAARLSLAGEVGRAWFAVAEARRQFELSRSSLESFRLSAERVRVRFQSGLRPALDLRLALTEVARAEASVAQREEQVARAVRRLEILLGRYPGGALTTAFALPEPPGQVPGGLPSELVHRRPDLAAAELQVHAAHARTVQSRAELRPRFSLTSSIGTSSGQLLDLLDGRLFVWSFVGNLVQPLFNHGRLNAAVARGESQTDLLMASYESQLLRAYGEVESALAAEDILAAREQAVGRAVEQATAARELAEERYRSGLTDIITVLSAQRTAYDSESQLLGLRRLRLENRVDLHLALGGGFHVDEIPSVQDLTEN